MTQTDSYFLESVVEAFADARNARLETPSSIPTRQEKVAPVPPQDLKQCPKCQTVTSNFGKGRGVCRPCYSEAVNTKQHENANPIVYGLVIDNHVCYVGSTTLSPTCRLSAWRSAARQNRSLLIARHLRTLKSLDEVSIVVLETLPGAQTVDLHRAEYRWIKQLSMSSKLYQTIGVKVKA